MQAASVTKKRHGISVDSNRRRGGRGAVKIFSLMWGWRGTNTFRNIIENTLRNTH
jgi:hypothetical protein